MAIRQVVGWQQLSKEVVRMANTRGNKAEVVLALPPGGLDAELIGSSMLMINGVRIYGWPELTKEAQTASRLGRRLAEALGVELVSVEVENPRDTSRIRDVLAERGMMSSAG